MLPTLLVFAIGVKGGWGLRFRVLDFRLQGLGPRGCIIELSRAKRLTEYPEVDIMGANGTISSTLEGARSRAHQTGERK